ncbi:ferredoxin--NADP+ reductase [Prauserella shujinwangii]|uniref:ferredoxin--NADP(+) reductase n=1 Tax=Prauserella shujinwangii TaxID=1453103 RepID=A0A2T0M061_9PSEU|nr:4Fe-4S binding protein [Prauserella shujinwangii]PRX49930.1 ferredoxin--NADP+ reductase [Prauserella shujinwangii]
MPYAITQTCCTDASCVAVCPVNCIHPTPDEPEFATTDMLYIDPRTCIDCGACADACPVDAVFPADRLTGPDAVYVELNRRHFGDEPADDTWGAPEFPRSLPAGAGPLRVAVVGTGPAAGYTIQSLLRSTSAEVTVLDRLPVPGGLVRFGVAPDHPSTKNIGRRFATNYRHPRVRMHLNVEVGRDITHADLAAHHHAVVYAVGAAGDRTLGIPGEDLPGSIPATRFVGWCNAAPDVPGDAVDLSAERAVVVGTGNVALDVARILLSDPDELARTDIADHALAALRASKVREVVLLGRRGPEQAAFTRPEFLAMRDRLGAEIVVDDHGGVAGDLAAAAPSATAGLLRDLPAEPVDLALPPPEGRRLVLRFRSAPTRVLGDHQVRGLRVTGTGGERDIAAGLVVRSIGCRGVPLPGLPFDEDTGVIPHDRGRVGTGTYVVGWAKRGATGGIGANRACAAETVDALLDDAAAGRLTAPGADAAAFARLVRQRRPDAIGLREAESIDRAERRRGERAGRPRVKFATVPELLAAGRSRR